MNPICLTPEPTLHTVCLVLKEHLGHEGGVAALSPPAGLLMAPGKGCPRVSGSRAHVWLPGPGGSLGPRV